MADKYLPIQFFRHREGDEKRTEGGGDDKPPSWLLPEGQLIKKAEQLFTELNAFESIIAEKEKQQSIVPFVCKAKLEAKATAKSRRQYVEEIFNTSHVKSNIIGIVDRTELVVRIDSLQDLKTITNKIANYDRNIFGLSCLDRIISFEPKIIDVEKCDDLKIKLLDFQDYNDNFAIVRLFEKTLRDNGIAFKKTEYAEAFSIYKIQCEQTVLLDMFKQHDIFEALLSIEPMPQYALGLDSLPFEQTVPIKKPVENENYATLGILDNGIARIPHLEPWLVGEPYSPYPEDSIISTHGTFVAGVAAYGDELEEVNWIGHKGIKLFDAAVYPDTKKESIDEDDLIENIKEAIKHKYEDVKIWNLSISVKRPIAETDFSDLAKALDSLQEIYNVLICKSAGNCDNFVKGHPKGKLHEGADSVLSLVVGSLAHTKGQDDIADIDNPSPFSRIGPGPEFIVKPELVHYGGNAGVKVDGTLSVSGVKSFSVDGKVSHAVGTSHSTPRIASLATGLYQEMNQEFDPLLIKAMLIHSANYPDTLNIPYVERTKYVGFGKPPTVQEMLYNEPHEITLILRETLVKGKYLDILDFPMPSCFIKDGFFTGQIVATLVYAPILEPSQGAEYCQSNIDVLLGTYDSKVERNTSSPNILNRVGRDISSKNIFSNGLYSKQKIRNGTGTFAQRERVLIQYADKYYPVKKYAVDLSEMTEANKRYITANKNWYLKLTGLYRSFTEQKAAHIGKPQQEFCLMVTIKDPTETHSVYNETIQKLDGLNFWHSNINLTSRISVKN